MTFPNVGTTIGNMLKYTELNMKWQERKENINKPKGNDAPEVQRLREMADDARKSNYVQSIKSKLLSGGSLSTAELDYLKSNHPELYQDALEVRQEREQYKRDLENCRTQEDVDRLNISRLNSFVGQAKSISSNPNIPLEKKVQMLEKIAGKAMGVQVEFNKFLQAGNYDRLPSEQEEDEEKKKARKKAQQEHMGDLMSSTLKKLDEARASNEKTEQNAENVSDENGDGLQAAQTPAEGETALVPGTGAPQGNAPQQAAPVFTPAATPTASAPVATEVTTPAPQATPAPANSVKAASPKTGTFRQGGFSVRV